LCHHPLDDRVLPASLWLARVMFWAYIPAIYFLHRPLHWPWSHLAAEPHALDLPGLGSVLAATYST